MGKRFLRRILVAVLLLIFVAALAPIIVSYYLKLHPDKIINKNGIPQVLKQIENDDLSCSISCDKNKVVLSHDQLQTMREHLQHFFRNANIKFYEPDKHKIAPYYCINYYDIQKNDKHPLITILVYVNEHMIEMFYSNEELVFTIEKQDFLQLIDIIMDLCPSSDIKPMVDDIRRDN